VTPSRRRSPSAVEIGVAARFMVPRNPLRSPYMNENAGTDKFCGAHRMEMFIGRFREIARFVYVALAIGPCDLSYS
jgi:hypothetical protein